MPDTPERERVDDVRLRDAVQRLIGEARGGFNQTEQHIAADGIVAAFDALLAEVARLRTENAGLLKRLDGYENFTWPDGSTENAGLATYRLWDENTALRARLRALPEGKVVAWWILDRHDTLALQHYSTETDAENLARKECDTLNLTGVGNGPYRVVGLGVVVEDTT